MSEDRVVAVFPLPDVVFFPRTVLPLHVFEKRYRAMVKDALAADSRLAVALLQPGWQVGYEGSPAFYDVATIGRIIGEALANAREVRLALKSSPLLSAPHSLISKFDARFPRFDPSRRIL